MKSLFSLVISLTLLPILVLAFYFSFKSYQEEDDFRSAKVLSSETPRHGDLVKLIGTPNFDALVVEELSSEKNVIQFFMYQEILQNGNWVRDRGFEPLRKVIADFKIGTQTVVIKNQSRLHFPIEVKTILIDESHRKIIKFRKINDEVLVFGFFNHDTISDGNLVRMQIGAKEQEEEIYKSIAIESRQKGKYLVILGGIFLLISILTLLWGFYRRSRESV